MTNETSPELPRALEALRQIRDARDHLAEYGRYPDMLGSYQCFDDWAADLADQVLRESRREWESQCAAFVDELTSRWKQSVDRCEATGEGLLAAIAKGGLVDWINVMVDELSDSRPTESG